MIKRTIAAAIVLSILLTAKYTSTALSAAAIRYILL